MEALRVVECDSSHQSAWDAFVEACPHASFYHRYGWRAVNAGEFGHRSLYFAAIDGGRIAGVFPIVLVRSLLFGRLACSMPFVNFGGPCGEAVEAEQALIDAAARFVKRERVAYLEMRNRHRLGCDVPTSERKRSMVLDLHRDPEVLWGGFKTGHRQDIRKGMKNGFTARCGGMELLDAFYGVLAESWHELGTPFYRKDYFARILNAFPSHTRICVAYAGDEPAAAALDGLHRDTVEGMWLGTRAKYRGQLAGYVLYWELIRDACQRGYSRYHLGRSTSDSGAEAFKKKWNAQATPLYWQYILGTHKEIPQLNVDNPRYRFAIRTWRRLPSRVTDLVGPHIARSIP